MALKKFLRYTIVAIAGILGMLCTILIPFLWLIERTDHQKELEEKMMLLNKNTQGEYPLVAKLGEPIQTVKLRNPNFFNIGDMDFGPAFMYSILPRQELPKVHVELLDEDFKRAFDMTGFKDVRLVSESYPEVQVGHFLGKLPLFKPCTEDQAQDTTECNKSKYLFNQYATITTILKKYGWKPYIELQQPRLFGKQSWYEVRSNSDGYYIDSFEKWQKYIKQDRISVSFYHKNLIMQLIVNDITSRIEIYTNNFNYVMQYDEHTRGQKWKQYLAEDVIKWAKLRQESEDELKAKGFTISEDYVDAPLPKAFYEK